MSRADLAMKRKKLGWSQEKLARECGVSLKTVWNAEHDHLIVSPPTLANIERVLNRAERRQNGGETNDG